MSFYFCPTGTWGSFFARPPAIDPILTPMNRPELELAMTAAREAGELMLNYYEGDFTVRNKRVASAGEKSSIHLRAADYDPVTSADVEADSCLKRLLSAANPEWGWLSEETADSPDRLQRETVWIVDPMDGTKEFLEGIPEFVVSIALVERGVPIVGVIYNPPTGDLFSALRGGGTFLNGKRVFCTETAILDLATVGVSRSEQARGEVDPFEAHVGEIKPIGSVAYKLAIVASGATDLNISVLHKNEWDVCAGDLLVREAGGIMTDLNGTVRTYNQSDPLIRGGIVAGNQGLAEAAVLLLSEQG